MVLILTASTVHDDHGAPVKHRSSLGTTPLSLACHAKHVEAVEAECGVKRTAEVVVKAHSVCMISMNIL